MLQESQGVSHVPQRNLSEVIARLFSLGRGLPSHLTQPLVFSQSPVIYIVTPLPTSCYH